MDDGAEACTTEAEQQVTRLGSVPLPGAGATLDRWRALAEVATVDLSVARLVEGHFDAIAILAELAYEPGPGLLAVWAARPEELRAKRVPDGWVLSGHKPYCSGAGLVDGALVTAVADDGPRLFLIAAPDAEPVPGSWRPLGMAATRSETVRLDALALDDGAAVGPPHAYVDRPGFAHGGCGVAACWWGGARAVLGDLAAVAAERPDDLALAALGDAALSLRESALVLREAAAAIDAAPRDHEVARTAAAETRSSCARSGAIVLATASRFLGTAGLGSDPAVAGRVADLTTYLTQHRPAVAIDLGRRHLVTAVAL